MSFCCEDTSTYTKQIQNMSHKYEPLNNCETQPAERQLKSDDAFVLKLRLSLSITKTTNIAVKKC